jgi:cobalamin biosynthesis protein CobT
MSYLKPGLYVGVFALAYGIFVYQNYSTEQHKPADTQEATGKHSDAISARDTTDNLLASAQTSHTAVYSYTEPYRENSRYSPGTDTSSGQTRDSNQQRYEAEQSDATATAETQATRPAGTSFSISSGLRNIANNSSTDTTSDVSESPSNTELSDIPGYEFLPDGKSQQDEYENNSGKPRSYSIADYQKSNINCGPDYAKTDGHGQLIQQLKGC